MEVQEVKEQLKAIFRTVINNDKWITIHPNGEDGKGRPLLLKDGESPKEAIERTYGDKKESKKKFETHYIVWQKNGEPYILDKTSFENWKENNKEHISTTDIDYITHSDIEKLKKDAEARGIDVEKEGGENYLISQIADLKKEDKKEKQKQSDTKDGKEERIEARKKHQEVVKKHNQAYKDFEDGKISMEELDKADKELEKSNKEFYGQSDKKEEKYEIPKDYKDSVKGYSKEKHEQAADFYGEKMATVQKKSVAHPDNEDYRKQFEEYKALKDYHEEKAKSDSKGDKKYTWDNKEYTADELMKKGFKPMKYSGSIYKDDHLTYLEKNDGKKLYRVKISEDEYSELEKKRQDKNKQLRLFNNKEQDMALLEELKKLITKVENTKGEKDMEIENEKVDKRKLIDEVGGILKGKVDDEIIRTIIGKLEKVAYDKSEAGTADNEKEDAESCKIKNKDDEKEVKEVEEEVKEDVENKCKNSVENAKVDYFAKLNEIYNATSQVKKEASYVSRADREKAAEDYFAK